jgi:hypothetical protein
MAQEKTIFTEEELHNIIQDANDTIVSNLMSATDEELIVEYAKAISRNEPEYFEKPARELVLEWALKYAFTKIKYIFTRTV